STCITNSNTDGSMMDITLDPLSTVPLYQQIRDRIVEAIARGELHRGDPLASVRQLAGAFAINPATVAKAYDQLRSEGLVATNAKSGSFVAADRDTAIAPPDYLAGFESRLYTLLAEGRARGLSEADLAEVCTRAVSSLNPREETP
ncbi:MAG: GntR family transcriptional regulator, partial [Bowdeniella nasicola]|nr:GntR family transcriptional regulator [Bowdeniella nasicola]